MSAIPFAVDLEKVKKIFASEDQELLEKIKTIELYDTYASQDDNLDEVLYDILFNYIPLTKRIEKKSFFGLVKSKPDNGLNQNWAHRYGYALLVACDYLGISLLPASDGFYYGEDFKSAVTRLKEKGLTLNLEEMFDSKQQVFDIPAIIDFPLIHTFSRGEIAYMNEFMKTIDFDENKADIDNEDFDEVEVMLKDLRDCFTQCYEQQLDLITFMH